MEKEHKLKISVAMKKFYDTEAGKAAKECFREYMLVHGSELNKKRKKKNKSLRWRKNHE